MSVVPSFRLANVSSSPPPPPTATTSTTNQEPPNKRIRIERGGVDHDDGQSPQCTLSCCRLLSGTNHLASCLGLGDNAEPVLNMWDPRYARDRSPLVEGCPCPACRYVCYLSLPLHNPSIRILAPFTSSLPS